MEVLILKAELEEKFHLSELMNRKFKMKIIRDSSIPVRM
jgi:hypothetical protein